jgi:hypothetical protein
MRITESQILLSARALVEPRRLQISREIGETSAAVAFNASARAIIVGYATFSPAFKQF